MVEVCDYCGGGITGPKPWRRDYCSRDCSNKDKSQTTKILVCNNCGDEYERPVSYLNQVDSKFCSQGCSNSFHHTGERNYHYVDGGSGGRRYGPNWDEQRSKALKRDFYRCRVCNISDDKCKEKYQQPLVVHHKTPRRCFDNLKRANRLRNLITVCPRCHGVLEAEINS